MPRLNRQYDPEDLGKYTVIEEIAEGTFGKVKSGSLIIHLISCIHLTILVAIHTVTGNQG